MRYPLLSVVTLIAGLVMTGPGTALAADDIRFPESGWSTDLLSALASGPRYLDRDLDTMTPPPRANDDPVTLTELAWLEDLARHARSPEMVAEIERENNPALHPVSALHALGVLPGPEMAPLAWRLAMQVSDEASWFVLREKWRFQRARPTQLAPGLTTVIAVPPHAAYPSGHSTGAHAAALILSVVLAECAEPLMSAAFDIATRREIAGVHYRSDTTAGIHLAGTVVAALLAEDTFAAQIDTARAEISQLDASAFSCR